MRLETSSFKPARRQLQGGTFARRKASARLVAIRLLSLSHVYTVSSQPIGVGDIKLSDGAHLRLKMLIVDVKEIGFSPFGGVNFYANVTGGVYVESIPDSLRELVKDKPLFPGLELARDGWELLDIVEQKPAEALEVVQSSRGEFVVRVVAEAVMVAKNTHYRSPTNEPIYWVHWIYKVSWKPRK
jgi:hypothetical protein